MQVSCCIIFGAEVLLLWGEQGHGKRNIPLLGSSASSVIFPQNCYFQGDIFAKGPWFIFSSSCFCGEQLCAQQRISRGAPEPWPCSAMGRKVTPGSEPLGFVCLECVTRDCGAGGTRSAAPG